MEIPIACTLEPADARAQGDEWRALLGRLVERSERTAPGTLRLWLRAAHDELDAPAQLAQLVSLAQREKACCRFFSFSLEIEAEALAFVVAVPEGATAVLDDFAGLARLA
jgi:hypothetical protein